MKKVILLFVVILTNSVVFGQSSGWGPMSPKEAYDNYPQYRDLLLGCSQMINTPLDSMKGVDYNIESKGLPSFKQKDSLYSVKVIVKGDKEFQDDRYKEPHLVTSLIEEYRGNMCLVTPKFEVFLITTNDGVKKVTVQMYY